MSDPEREAVVLPRLGPVRPEVVLAAVRHAAPLAPEVRGVMIPLQIRITNRIFRLN